MTILAILLLVLLAGLAFTNMEIVAVNFYFTSVDLPLWLIIFGSAVLGMLIIVFLYSTRDSNARDERRRREKDLHDRLSRKNEELESARQEISNLTAVASQNPPSQQQVILTDEE